MLLVPFIFFIFRKRLYSWSRPSKHLPRPGRHDSEMEISGMATIAFSQDLSWFQGNIVNPQSDTFIIRGRLINESSDVDIIEKETEEKYKNLSQDNSLVFDSSSPNNSLISDVRYNYQ